ncbi:MAG TPA: lysylphosphatidylglycerol synthase transmembrane domain-containing protein [Acidobacteriaceae bacterium]|nr:lysylphosphatidylglycerol synthase transmembrane domain-containing protein [Acidobacteriaceae bacterium]
MKTPKSRILVLIAVLAVGALVWFGRHRIHFNWGVFAEQLRQAAWGRMIFALACIYFGYVIRSVRWAMLMRHAKRVPLLSLVGTQVIGFTAVALIGRVADLVRPYLVAKKTLQPLSSQIAVYIVERLFDAGAMALITFSVILMAPPGALPHPEVVKKASLLGMVLMVAGAIFLLAVRLAGTAISSAAGRAFGRISKKLGEAVENKIAAFQSGLDTIRSVGDFAITASLSVGMWLLIALAYLETARAFVAAPALGSMTAAEAVLLMVVSGTASAIQLPVLGWFTQIGLVEEAIRNFFGVAPEAAMGCAAALLLVTFLCIMPVGLVWARFEHVSLKKVAEESEHAGEKLAHHAAEPAS